MEIRLANSKCLCLIQLHSLRFLFDILEEIFEDVVVMCNVYLPSMLMTGQLTSPFAGPCLETHLLPLITPILLSGRQGFSSIEG